MPLCRRDQDVRVFFFRLLPRPSADRPGGGAGRGKKAPQDPQDPQDPQEPAGTRSQAPSSGGSGPSPWPSLARPDPPKPG